ncbi:glucosaminidase domain-containing protein [Actomonas aquatica]|uniref:Glucosaminidase domain-containing protein n=1 Tax=Actomonas aquatica TaxID=2866162 RepID=A0ABZ1C4E7_9BACT|nr:glucosaminidase domain-containing protein [Opitutus sp. WL0086]WRQ86434.1 glucosaminidase domain-containing protein [Opitutus sp. WL0086]
MSDPRRRAAARKLGIAGIVVVAILIWSQCSRHAPSFLPFVPEHLPDFADYTDVNEKKTAFFDFLAPHIEAVNQGILKDRRRLEAIRADAAEGDAPGWIDRRWITHLAERYEFEDIPEKPTLAFVDQLLRRVDIIPPSLIMAQAANESAWGTSRFARQGNNLFGMRTYEPGTGIVPKRRAAGATWEVAAYDTVREGLADYIQTLNTGSTYRQLRNLRRDLRRQDRTISGSVLAGGLTRYSEKGYEYVAIIRSMIRSNKLAQYDEAHMAAERGE